MYNNVDRIWFAFTLTAGCEKSIGRFEAIVGDVKKQQCDIHMNDVELEFYACEGLRK